MAKNQENRAKNNRKNTTSNSSTTSNENEMKSCGRGNSANSTKNCTR